MPATRDDFLTADLGALEHDDSGHRFDRDIAFEHYQAAPDRWHEVTQDNPAGDPIAAMVLADGPWWVKE